MKINGKGQKLWVFPAAIHSEVLLELLLLLLLLLGQREPLVARSLGLGAPVLRLRSRGAARGAGGHHECRAQRTELEPQPNVLARAAQQRAWSRRQQQHGAEVTGQRVTREPGLGSPRARAGRAARKSRRASI